MVLNQSRPARCGKVRLATVMFYYFLLIHSYLYLIVFIPLLYSCDMQLPMQTLHNLFLNRCATIRLHMLYMPHNGRTPLNLRQHNVTLSIVGCDHCLSYMWFFPHILLSDHWLSMHYNTLLLADQSRLWFLRVCK